MYNSFMAISPEDVPIYCETPSYEELRTVLDVKLVEHNEANPVMDLVLFKQVRALRAESLCYF